MRNPNVKTLSPAQVQVYYYVTKNKSEQDRR